MLSRRFAPRTCGPCSTRPRQARALLPDPQAIDHLRDALRIAREVDRLLTNRGGGYRALELRDTLLHADINHLQLRISGELRLDLGGHLCVVSGNGQRLRGRTAARLL